MGIVLKDVTAVGETDAVRLNLRIEGRTISAVSEAPLPRRSEDTQIEAGGKLALPGLVNAHTHLPMTLFRGLADEMRLRPWLEEHIWPRERALCPEDVYWGALLGLAEMIRGGTTACADMYFHVDDVARAVEEAGVRALLSYGMIAERMDETGRSEVKKAAQVIAQMDGAAEGRIRGAVSPHAVYTCGEPVWRAAIDLAADRDVPLHTHLAETREEITWSLKRYGERPVEFLDRIGAFSVPVLAAHGVHLEGPELVRLADRPVTVVHCPKSNAKLGNGIAPVAAMRRVGVQVALGTDGAATNNSLDLVEEMRFAALLGKASAEDPTALPAAGVFEMATRVGARALRLGAGRFAVGAPADIVLIDAEGIGMLPAYAPLTSLVYAAHATDVTDVIVDGRFLLRNRELVTIDEDRVKHEVKKIAARYVN
jgi:5-methylthioadenosine/S-adenosylhomocysteine deaminase